MPLSMYSTGASILLVGVAFVTDLRARRIPNLLTFPAAGFGLALNLSTGGWEGLLLSISGLLLAPCLLSLVHGGKGPGMGDIKLVAALGAILGPVLGTVTVLVSAVVGGFLAAGWMLWPWLRISMPQGHRSERRSESPEGDAGGVPERPNRFLGKFPYGVAVSIGTLLTLALSWSTGGQKWPF